MGKNVYSSEVKWAVVKDKLSGKFGSVDAIVNNAGLMPLSHLHKNQQDEWNTMVDVNIKGVLHGIGAVCRICANKKADMSSTSLLSPVMKSCCREPSTAVRIRGARHHGRSS